MANASEIITCTCKHEFQDAEYGKQKRLATVQVKDKTGTSVKCTVCGTPKKLNVK